MPDDLTATLNQTPTEYFVAGTGVKINRIQDRVFIGTDFGGEFTNMTGLTPLAKALHAWGPRDSQVFVDSTVGAMAIVGHVQSSRANSAWPAYPSYKPAGIGISGFAINDLAGGSAWAGYMDAVRMAGAGFTPTMEICNANFGTTNTITPFNHLTGVSNAVTLWMATGNGLDLVGGGLAPLGLSWKDINHSDAIAVFLTSIASSYAGNPTLWKTNTHYAVDDLAIDPQTQIIYRATVAHTSPSAGLMSTDRATNTSRWKQLPAAKKGLIFTAGSLAELYPGTNVFSAMEMHERVQLSWWRGDATWAEQSAYIWSENIPRGSPAVGITWTQYGARFDNSNVILDASKGVIVGGKKVVGAQQAIIPSPNAEVNSLKSVVDAIRQLLANHGLMSPS
jgi:hypothetical protein